MNCKLGADVEQYEALSGDYHGPNGNEAYLNFGTKWLTWYSETSANGPRDTITEVLRHEDGSLVFHVESENVSGGYRYIAILVVPAGKKLTKNWQTGAKFTDQSDSSYDRFARGYSKDGGVNYDLSDAKPIWEGAVLPAIGFTFTVFNSHTKKSTSL